MRARFGLRSHCGSPAGLGVLGAIALLAGCGPSKASLDDDGGDQATDDDGGAAAQCTIENYADDPRLSPYAEVGCFAAEGGACPVCDLACMESIVSSCQLSDCTQPDLSCSDFDACFDHQTLCSEQLGDQCCYLVTAEYGGGVPGRPLREAGVPRLPSLRVRGRSDADPGRRAAAAAYRELARFERASVAAFVDAATHLAALGAPAQLVADHQQAAAEEARHAELALAAATALDGRHATLADPPPPTPGALDLTAFVRDLIHDGCVGEHAAAHEAAWALAEVADQPALAAYWRPLVNEEARHAALAWATLEWLLEVRPQLRPLAAHALAAARSRAAVERPSAGEVALGFGLASARRKQAVRAAAWAELLSEARSRAA